MDVNSARAAHADGATGDPSGAQQQAPAQQPPALQRQDSSLMQVMHSAEQQKKNTKLTNKQVREQLLQRLAEPRALVAAASLSSDLSRRQRRARMARASAKNGQTLLSQVPANIKHGRKTKAGVRRVLGTGSEGRGGPTGGELVDSPSSAASPSTASAAKGRRAAALRQQEEDEVPSAEQLARHILSQIAQTAPGRGGSSSARSPEGGKSTDADPARTAPSNNEQALQSISSALQDAAADADAAGGTSSAGPAGDLDSTGVVTALLHKLAADPLVPLSRPDMMLTAEELAASKVGQYIAQYITRSSSSVSPAARRGRRGRREGETRDGNTAGDSDTSGSSASLSESSEEEWEVHETHEVDGSVSRKLVPASNARAVERRRRRAARAERQRALLRTADSVRSTEPIWGEMHEQAPGSSPVERTIARMTGGGKRKASASMAATHDRKTGAATTAGHSATKQRSGTSNTSDAVLSPLAVGHTLAFSSLLSAATESIRAPSVMSVGSARSASIAQSVGQGPSARRRRDETAGRAGEGLVQVAAVADMAAVEQMLSNRSPRSGRLVGTAAHGSRSARSKGRGLINSGFVALAASEAAAAAAARRGDGQQQLLLPLPPANAAELPTANGHASADEPTRRAAARGGRLSQEALHTASAQAAMSLAHERRVAKQNAEGGAVTLPLRALRQLAREAARPKIAQDPDLEQVSETAVVFRDAEESASAAAAQRDRSKRLAALRRAEHGRSSLQRAQSKDVAHTDDPPAHTSESTSVHSPSSSLGSSRAGSLSAPKSSSLKRALDAARASAEAKEAAHHERQQSLPSAIRGISDMADAARSVQFNVVAAAAQAKQRQQQQRRDEQLKEAGSQRPARDNKPWRQRSGRRKRKSARSSPRPGAVSRASAASAASRRSAGSRGEAEDATPPSPLARAPVPPLAVSLLGAQSDMHSSSDAAVHAHLQSAVQRMRAFQRLATDAHARHETAVEFTSMVGAGAATAMAPLRSYVEKMSDGWGRVASSTARVHRARERLAAAAGQYASAGSSSARARDGTRDAQGQPLRSGGTATLQSLQRAAASLSARQSRLAATDFNSSRAGTGDDGTRRKFWQRHGGVRQVALQHLSEAETARRQRMLDHLNALEAQGIPLPVDSSVGQRSL